MGELYLGGYMSYKVQWGKVIAKQRFRGYTNFLGTYCYILTLTHAN